MGEARGDSVNAAARDAFAACLDSCHLLDLGFNGHPFTWKHGDLQECLDRILCSSSWQAAYLASSVTHLSLPSSDHSVLWLRMLPGAVAGRKIYFKFLSPWLEHEDFANQITSAWIIET